MTRLHVPTRVRWSDLDGYRHVNNASMLRLLEEARIDAFWSPDASVAPTSGAAVLDGRPESDTMTLIARQELEYLAPIPYLRAPLDVQVWVGRLGGASLEVCYEVWSPVGTVPAQLFTKAATTIVLVDSSTGAPRRISDVERAAWAPYVGEPLSFRRR
ncbi:acyl-CoA thioester hydrolase [Frigoribacterium sp. PhB160]|uniref:acyl-CoA thioesterase n=1 Tax=Frigoribacterium sp. PhB160 TaxID=2485192 RepID=UPI000F467EFF|nr:thioesterase family protein [Frigoribacterium sp. PhB160]ROS59570.1 acyl-CoA thioester hydrolase [Frigoribacterium sp. PhB160]